MAHQNVRVEPRCTTRQRPPAVSPGASGNPALAVGGEQQNPIRVFLRRAEKAAPAEQLPGTRRPGAPGRC
jgi:hypothetical protein